MASRIVIVLNEPHLVGERRTAAGAAGSELSLVHLDQDLTLARCTTESVVDVLSGARGDIGHHETDIEAERGRFAPCTGASSVPGPQMTAASFSATRTLRSAAAKIITAAFDVIRPPSKAAVFSRWTTGKQKAATYRRSWRMWPERIRWIGCISNQSLRSIKSLRYIRRLQTPATAARKWRRDASARLHLGISFSALSRSMAPWSASLKP
jgi:hypothetical protein